MPAITPDSALSPVGPVSSPRAALPFRRRSPTPRFLSDTGAVLTEAASRDVSSLLGKRQSTTVAIPSVYLGLDAGPPPGTVIGITLGSVLGFLLLVWLLSVVSGKSGGGGGGDVYAEEEVVVRQPRSGRSRRSEVREYSRSPARPARIIVEERRTTGMPRAGGIDDRQNIRRVMDDGIIEVTEDSSPPRRKKSSRQPGYRAVDPDAYGGGDYSRRPVRSRRYS